jgi:putative tryptophan/tyrosine transport system substrate-binding protein
MRHNQLSRLVLICALAVVMWMTVVSQSSPRATPRIGLLTYWSCDDALRYEFASLLRGLEELGYRSGETIAFECEGGGKSYERMAAAASRLVQRGVDVIATSSQPAGRAARALTDKIPIVSVVSGDAVAAGLAESLAHPGGNFTGVSYYATELTAKRLELLKEAIPGIVKIGVLANPEVSYLPFEADTHVAAAKLGIELSVHQVTQPADLKGAFLAMRQEMVQAVFVLPDLMIADQAAHIADLAIENRMPSMGWGGWFAEHGCLMAYSADYDEMNHRLAYHIDRILKGANPGDLPIEQPTTFKLTINLKTAAKLGLELPQGILVQADDVIE